MFQPLVNQMIEIREISSNRLMIVEVLKLQYVSVCTVLYVIDLFIILYATLELYTDFLCTP